MTGELVMVNRAVLVELQRLDYRAPIVEGTPLSPEAVIRQCVYCGAEWKCRVTDTNVIRENHDFDCPVLTLYLPEPRPLELLNQAIDALSSHEEQRHGEARAALLELRQLLGGEC